MLRGITHASGIRTMISGLAFSLAAFVAAGPAQAGCGEPAAPAPEHSAAYFRSALYRPDDFGAAALRTVGDEWYQSAPIVGLWEFEFHLKGAQNGLPDGFLFDWDLATWHLDGTEIQFSGGRPPSAGDVCMGVWKQTGRATYTLHHVALGLSPPDASGTFMGPAIIRATVTLDADANTYSGPYSVTPYPGSPDNGTEFNETTNPQPAFVGVVTARRVSP